MKNILKTVAAVLRNLGPYLKAVSGTVGMLLMAVSLVGAMNHFLPAGVVGVLATIGGLLSSVGVFLAKNSVALEQAAADVASVIDPAPKTGE